MVHVMSEVERDVCHACVSLPRETHCPVCDPEIGCRKELEAQRLRADTAEAELAKANDKIDKAWRRSHGLDDKAYIPGAFDAWKRPVPQFLPYDFSGNPGTNATQYCNGWNDCGGYWKAHANEVEAKLAASEQRIAELIADVSAREALLSELGCPFDPVSDLYVENKASESMVSLVLGAHRRSKHAVSDAALNQKSEGGSQ